MEIVSQDSLVGVNSPSKSRTYHYACKDNKKNTAALEHVISNGSAMTGYSRIERFSVLSRTSNQGGR